MIEFENIVDATIECANSIDDPKWQFRVDSKQQAIEYSLLYHTLHTSILHNPRFLVVCRNLSEKQFMRDRIFETLNNVVAAASYKMHDMDSIQELLPYLSQYPTIQFITANTLSNGFPLIPNKAKVFVTTQEFTHDNPCFKTMMNDIINGLETGHTVDDIIGLPADWKVL